MTKIKEFLNDQPSIFIPFLCFILSLLLTVLIEEHRIESLLFAVIFYMQYSHATIVENLRKLRVGDKK